MAMAISDLSLDDIIKKKYVNISPAKKGLKNRQITTKKINKQNVKNNFKVKKSGQQVNKQQQQQQQQPIQKKTQIADARLKIIQKNREKLKDARDKLAEIAKQGDARSKLDRLRGKNARQTIVGGGGATQISRGITLRKGRNGQISLSTNKKQSNNLTVQRRMSNLAQTNFGESQVVSLVPSNLVRRTVNNAPATPAHLAAPSRTRFSPSTNNLYTWINSNAPQSASSSMQMDQDHYFAQRAIFQQSTKAITGGAPPSSHLAPQIRSPLRMNASTNQQFKQLLRPSRIFPNSTLASDWELQQQQQVQKRLRENNSGVLTATTSWGRMSSELKARLDTAPIPPRTMGILGTQTSHTTNTMPQEPIGYRIIVSNLQMSVTHDDIKELFEDIGPLVTSRMVRPGVAEVVYRNHKDAVKAVDVYHNRQLDGQPMKCMLVKPTPTQQQQQQQQQQQGPMTGGSVSSRTSRLAGTGVKLPSKSMMQIVPDIDTIHKALFK